MKAVRGRVRAGGCFGAAGAQGPALPRAALAPLSYKFCFPWSVRQHNETAIPERGTWLTFLLRAEPKSSHVSNPAERAGCCRLPAQATTVSALSALWETPESS